MFAPLLLHYAHTRAMLYGLHFCALHRRCTASPASPISTSPGALESAYRLVFLQIFFASSGAAGGAHGWRENMMICGIFRDAKVRRVKAARRRRRAAPEHTVWRADRCATKLGPVAFGGRADGPDIVGLESALARAKGHLEVSRGSAS